MGIADIYNDLFSGNEEDASDADKSLPSVRNLVELKAAGISDDRYEQIRIDGFRPSSFAKYSCIHAVALARKLQEPVKIDFDLRKILSMGDQRHSWYQDMLSDHLTGTWKCRRCGAVHNQQSGYTNRLRKLQKDSSIEASGKELLNEILGRIVSESFLPVRRPEKCLRCDGSSFEYAEWRIFDEDYGVIAKIDGLLEAPDTERCIIEIKSVNSNLFQGYKTNPDHPKLQQAKKQLSIYLSLLNRVLPVSYGIVFTEERNFGADLKFVVKRDDSILDILTAASEYYSENEADLMTMRPEWNSDCTSCEFRFIYCNPGRSVKYAAGKSEENITDVSREEAGKHEKDKEQRKTKDKNKDKEKEKSGKKAGKQEKKKEKRSEK